MIPTIHEAPPKYHFATNICPRRRCLVLFEICLKIRLRLQQQQIIELELRYRAGFEKQKYCCQAEVFGEIWRKDRLPFAGNMGKSGGAFDHFSAMAISTFPCGLFDGVEDAGVAGAAAEVSGEAFLNL